MNGNKKKGKQAKNKTQIKIYERKKVNVKKKVKILKLRKAGKIIQ